MALNSENVRVARTGEFSYAWLGEDEDWTPTVTREGEIVTVSLPPLVYKPLGYFSTEGFSRGSETTTDTRRAWQNADVIGETVTEVNEPVTLNPIEMKREVLELVRNAKMDADGTITSDLGNPKRVCVFGSVTDGDRTWFQWLPSASVSSREVENYNNDGEVGYALTLTPYKRIIDGVTWGPIWENYPFLAL